MVKKIIYIFILIGLLSCAGAQSPNKQTLYNFSKLGPHWFHSIENDIIYEHELDSMGRMILYLMSYVNSYYNHPKDINSLIHAFDRLQKDEENSFYESYRLTYKFMEKYKNQLIICSGDSLVSIFYKKVKLPNLIVTISAEPDYLQGISLLDGSYSCFDKDGYYVYNEELTNKFRQEYWEIILKYRDIGFKKEEPFHKIIYIEFIPNKNIYRDIENNKPIYSHPFFDELKIWLQEQCAENEFSRMVIPSRIPNDY